MQLLLERHSPKEVVQGLAAGDAVLIIVLATVRQRYEVLDAGLCLGELVAAKEAVAALGEEKSLNRSSGHLRRLT